MANVKPRKSAPVAAAPRIKRKYVRKVLAAAPAAPAVAKPKPKPLAAAAKRAAPVNSKVAKAIDAAAPEFAPAPAPAPVSEMFEAAVAVSEPIADAITKGPDMATTDTLKTNSDAATDRVQAIFGDVNGRAKTAIEKSSKLFEEMTEFTKGNVEAIVASGRVAAKGAETLGQEAAEYGKKSFEQASATFRSFSGVKSPTELFQMQSEYARTSFDAIVAESSKLSESFLKLAGDIAQPLSSRLAVAADKVKSAAAF